MARAKPTEEPERDPGAGPPPTLSRVLEPSAAGLEAIREGRRRLVIEGVSPEIDGGRFPIKRVVGEAVTVEADVFADGHDLPAAALRWRREDERDWNEVPMTPLGNDRWRASFAVEALGRYRYTIRAWVDRFGTWRRDLEKKVAAAQDVAVELLGGTQLVERAASRASGEDRKLLRAAAHALRAGAGAPEPADTRAVEPVGAGAGQTAAAVERAVEIALDPEVA